MNTTYGATQEQRETAEQIITELDARDIAQGVSEVTYYSIWGLATAVLNVRDRNDYTYRRWIDMARRMLQAA